MVFGARVLVTTAALIVSAGIIMWLAQRSWFDFKKIEVYSIDGQSPRHVTEASIRSVMGAHSGLAGNFFTMNLAQARATFESIPWVARASVRRVWPDRLIVTLDEHRAIGLWQDGRVLSDRGHLFIANVAEADLDGPLAQFAGSPDSSQTAAQQFHRFNALLAPLQMSVSAIEISDRTSWRMDTAFQNARGPHFELGRDEPAGRVHARLASIVSAWPMVIAQLGQAPARIDARYANGFAAAIPHITRTTTSAQ